MTSLDHMRKRVRQVCSKAVSVSKNLTVINSVSKRMRAGIPFVRVSTPHSEEELLGGPPLYYNCKTMLLISIAASDADGLEDRLDDLAAEVHELILREFHPSSEFDSIKRVKTNTEFREGGSENVGVIDIWYEVSYSVKETLRTITLKKYKGTEASFGG